VLVSLFSTYIWLRLGVIIYFVQNEGTDKMVCFKDTCW